MRLSRLALVALMIASPLQVALAADWQLVLSDRNRRVEIDRGSILTSDRGTKVSWGRVVLANNEVAAAGYATIKALNRYDCQNRTFSTIKRVYLDADENLVREETVEDQTPLRVTPNSVDERMWREVCGPPSVADLQKVADEVQKLADTMQPKLEAAAPAAPRVPAPAPAKTEPPSKPAAAQPARPAPIETGPAAAQAVRAAEPPKSADGAPANDAAENGGKKLVLPPLPNIRPAKPDPETVEREAPKPAPAEPARKAEKAPPPARTSPARRSEPPRAVVRETPRPQPPAPVALARPQVKAPAVLAAEAAADPVEALLRAKRDNPFDPGWRYEGELGPDAWGRLRPDWRLCSEGTRQSPIDLRDGVAVDLAPVKFHYRSTGFRIRDTGNTLQIDVGEGMGVEIRGTRYELERFTLHRPSQERVGGMAYDMAAYLEHRSADGRTAIVSILLQAGGAPNALLQTLWNNLPLDRGREFVPDAVIDLRGFVPDNPAHFLYLGSLPVPPCTEDVTWVVMKTPVPMADDQLAVFGRLYPRNTRPIQPANGRLVLESR